MLRKMVAAMAAGASVICGFVACTSAGPPAPDQPGAETPGTATVHIDGQDAGVTHQVSCVPSGALTKIAIGNEQSGATAVVSNEEALAVKSVDFRDLTGFTGSFNQGLGGGDAGVTMIGRTYRMSGTASGFTSADPSHSTSRTFSIAVGC
jgi:lipoprotein LpqH